MATWRGSIIMLALIIFDTYSSWLVILNLLEIVATCLWLLKDTSTIRIRTGMHRMTNNILEYPLMILIYYRPTSYVREDRWQWRPCIYSPIHSFKAERKASQGTWSRSIIAGLVGSTGAVWLEQSEWANINNRRGIWKARGVGRMDTVGSNRPLCVL